jgi:hypothetical protein
MRTLIATTVFLALFGFSTAALAGDLYGRATPYSKVVQKKQQQEEARIKALQAEAQMPFFGTEAAGPGGWTGAAASPGGRTLGRRSPR